MATVEPGWNRPPLDRHGIEPQQLTRRGYEKELKRLRVELVRLQDWIVHKRLKVVVLFEGRDTAGKGGTIKRITEKTNPRVVRTVALGTPTERERTQWYFQRYVAHLPAGGEIVCLTAAGTTAPASSTSWATARHRSMRSSCGPVRSSNATYCAPESSSSSTGCRSATKSRSAASTRA
jgi:Polyphosphate kinase 2 (PPK2)